MQLYLVQHAEAVSKDVDPGRPLSSRGEHDAGAMATFLQQSRVEVETIVHSGKMRAHQTAELLAEKILLQGDVAAIPGINPDDPVDVFAAKVSQLRHNTMIVGHLPFMARLVSLLVSGNPEDSLVAFTPGTVVCLEHVPEEGWRVSWMIRPELVNH